MYENWEGGRGEGEVLKDGQNPLLWSPRILQFLIHSSLQTWSLCSFIPLKKFRRKRSYCSVQSVLYCHFLQHLRGLRVNSEKSFFFFGLLYYTVHYKLESSLFFRFKLRRVHWYEYRNIAIGGHLLVSPSLFLSELTINLLLKNLQKEDLKEDGNMTNLVFDILTYGCYHLT